MRDIRHPTQYRRVPKFWTYGSVCCACARRPGLPRACHPYEVEFMRVLCPQDKPAGEFKAALTELIVSVIVPIGDEIKRLCADPAHIDGVLDAAAAQASERARGTMSVIRQACGLA